MNINSAVSTPASCIRERGYKVYGLCVVTMERLFRCCTEKLLMLGVKVRIMDCVAVIVCFLLINLYVGPN